MDETKLEALFIGNELFEEIEQQFGVFCPFEAVGMERQEVRHAHFLQYCLDPQRPHGFGTECLRALMRAAAETQQDQHEDLKIQDFIAPLDVHVLDLDSADLRREWQRIDLLAVLHEQKIVIAIELKIDASEHSGQLSNYRKKVLNQWPAENNWRHIFLFITREGESTSADGTGWRPLSLKVVANELDTVVRRQVGQPEARSMLIAYLAMMRRNILTNERLSKLAAQLWAQHEEALSFLMDNRPETVNAFSSVASNLFGENPEKFSPIRLSGHEVIFNELRGNKASFIPTLWFQALGGADNHENWKGCQNWWAGLPLIVWLQLTVRNGGAGKIALYAEVGPLTDTILRKKLIYKIKNISEENQLNNIYFQNSAENENSLYSRFLRHNIKDVEDVSDQQELLDKAKSLIEYFMPILEKINDAFYDI